MQLNTQKLRQAIEKNMLDFVSAKTFTNSPHEKNAELFFEKWFASVPYFAQNPDLCGFDKIENDPHQRAVPWCLLKGKGDKTVVLIHHSDTVNTQDYAKHQIPEALALDPHALTQAFQDDNYGVLSRASETVKRDAKSGEWLFGRGVADMKGGGAIHLALLEQYAANSENFEGNIVLLSVPDEENLSAGMLHAVHRLKTLKQTHNLDYVLCMDVEAHERESDGRAIYYDGSIGKMMPLVYARGKVTHVGMIYGGLNPVNIVGEIVRQTECGRDWIFVTDNSVAPPPTWLYVRDTKSEYEVSIPGAAWGAMNILTLTESPQIIMKRLEKTAKKAFAKVVRGLQQSYDRFYALNVERGNTVADARPSWQPKVVHYADLYKEARKDFGDAFTDAYNKTVDALKTQKKTPIEGAVSIIETTLKFIKDPSPVVVLALIPPLYPCVGNKVFGEKTNKAKADRVTWVLKQAAEFTNMELNEGCRVKEYYNGISDLSYAMFPFGKSVRKYIDANMLYSGTYTLPLDLIEEISMPVLNIGPWGKDIHKYTERIYLPDLYGNTPLVTDFIITRLLKG
ncbi:MAG: M20/M25/M40 family metallo-hydrolase [Firmicutes bacterium]|nr:M20/M25/M40 family metallo-hydrolase [Bacillota bacterium]